MTSVLKIDIDFKAPEDWLLDWEASRKFLLESYKLTVLRVTRHETTKGQNYFIEIEEDLSPEGINRLQFLLGDDHTRVKINAWRIERGVPHWNKIFDRKLWRKEAKKVITCWYCENKIPLIGMDDEKEVIA